jgi:hypothetical protein
MSQLASNARQQGQPTQALQWYERAFDASQGPATRIQWGSSYLAALVELAPQDDARIERTATQLLHEADGQTAAFVERSARSWQRISQKLGEWNRDGRHAAVIHRIQNAAQPVCAKLPAGDRQRNVCESLARS